MKTLKICLVTLLVGAASMFYSQSTNTGASPIFDKYMIVQVTHDILDCPHFGMLIPAFVKNSLSSNVVENHPKEKYMVIHIKNTTLNEEEYKKKFIFLLDSVHFPRTSLKDLTISDKTKLTK